MIIKKEIDSADEVRDLVWSGGDEWVSELTDEQIEEILTNLDELYPDGMTDTELNDFFWFEADTYAKWLGYKDAEQLLERAGQDPENYSIDWKVQINWEDNPQFDESVSIEDNINDIIDYDDDYDYVDDSDEEYDEETDTYSGYVTVDISQAGMDKLRDSGVTFEEV